MDPHLLYLSRAEVVALQIPIESMIEALESAFLEKDGGGVEMPPKPGIHTRPNSFIHAMPAYVRSLDAAGVKWIAGYPANADRGLPYISGLLILNDSDTGLPIAVMDATWLTAERTAAATAVAARRLCRRDARSLAVLGCGVQGRANTRALRAVLPELERVQAYDVRPEAARAFAEWCRHSANLEARGYASAEEAVRGCDAVVTAGPILEHPMPTLIPAWLKEGAFVCALDFDSYVAPATFATAKILVTDDVAQLEYYRTIGYFGHVPPTVSELCAVISGRNPGRQTQEELAVAVNLGLALEDVVGAWLIYNAARRVGAGTRLPL